MPPLSVQALLADVLRIVANAVQPYRCRWLLLPPIIALCIWDIIPLNRPTKSLDELRSQNGLGCLAAIRLLGSVQCIILLDVQKDLRRKKDIINHTFISDASFVERLKWGMELFFSPRGVGWTHEPTSRLRWIPSHLSASRITFILHQIFRFAEFSVMLELLRLMLVLNPCIERSAADIPSSWSWRFSFFPFMLAGYTQMCQAQAILSILFVGVGISNPRDWPTISGSWMDAYTIRRFWGRSWHQMFRHMLQTYSKFISRRLFSLTPGSLLSRYTELYCAFAISGIMHWAGDYRLLGTLKKGTSIQFFMLQAFAIMVEDAINWSGDRLGVGWGTRWLRYIGYVWVTLWFTWTLPMWMEPMAGTGALKVSPEESLLLGPYMHLKEIIVAFV